LRQSAEAAVSAFVLSYRGNKYDEKKYGN